MFVNRQAELEQLKAWWLRPEAALAGRGREAVLLGEAKWARRVSAPSLRAELERKAAALPRLAAKPRYAICAREQVDNAAGVLAVTAEEIF